MEEIIAYILAKEQARQEASRQAILREKARQKKDYLTAAEEHARQRRIRGHQRPQHYIP